VHTHGVSSTYPPSHAIHLRCRGSLLPPPPCSKFPLIHTHTHTHTHTHSLYFYNCLFLSLASWLQIFLLYLLKHDDWTSAIHNWRPFKIPLKSSPFLVFRDGHHSLQQASKQASKTATYFFTICNTKLLWLQEVKESWSMLVKTNNLREKEKYT